MLHQWDDHQFRLSSRADRQFLSILFVMRRMNPPDKTPGQFLHRLLSESIFKKGATQPNSISIPKGKNPPSRATQPILAQTPSIQQEK